MKGLNKPRLKLVKGTRFTSFLFIGASILIAAGILWAANVYYDIDTSKVIVGESQQVTGTLTATTTQISVETSLPALTITQRGTGAVFSGTSTSAMTADAFKITNLGSGKSLVVEDADTDTTPFVVDASGKVGVATSTPSDTLAVGGDIIGSGKITLYGTSATSTFSAPIQVSRLKITDSPVADYVLTATDNLGNAAWKVIPAGIWTESGTYIYPTNWSARDVAIATTTARYDLDVWGNASFGTSTDYNTPLLLVNSYTQRVGIATTSFTPTYLLDVKGTIRSGADGQSGQLRIYSEQGGTDYELVFQPSGSMTQNTIYTWPTTYAAAVNYVLTSDTSGNLSWTSVSGVGGVDTYPTPGVGQVSFFWDANTIAGDSDFVWSTTTDRLGIATSTPSAPLSVGGNIIGSGNIVVYGTATSTFGGDLNIQGLKTSGNIWAAGNLTVSSVGGTITIQPASGSNADIILGGNGLFRVGSNGQFYIDASGNATTSGSIYAATFRAGDATVRVKGEQIVRGVESIFGFDLPARCNTACTSPNWATTTRTIANTNFFPAALSGTTRKYRFAITYASASSTATYTWQIATSSDNSSYQFTLPATGSTDITKAFATTSDTISSLPSQDWLLRVRVSPNGGYNFQVYQILLLGIDEVN